MFMPIDNCACLFVNSRCTSDAQVSVTIAIREVIKSATLAATALVPTVMDLAAIESSHAETEMDRAETEILAGMHRA